MNECTWLLYLHEDALDQELKLISHFKLSKRNANTTGSSLCSCHNSFPHDGLHKTFCSRPGGPLTDPPLFHAPIVSGTQDAFSPHLSKSCPSYCFPENFGPLQPIAISPFGDSWRNTETIDLGLHWHCNVSSRSAWAFK